MSKVEKTRKQQALNTWWHGQTLFVRETQRGM
jgi:hypothetical protein